MQKSTPSVAPSDFKRHVMVYYSGKKYWWLYIPLLIMLVWLAVGMVRFKLGSSSGGLVIGGIYFVEFGVHEISHLLFGFLPAIFTASAGSAGEVTFTLMVLYATLKSRAYFASVFAGLWVMFALSNTGQYMADARNQFLPLVGPGDDPQHDWHFVFGKLHLLNQDKLIGGTVRGIGITIGLASLAWGARLIYQMATHPKPIIENGDVSMLESSIPLAQAVIKDPNPSKRAPRVPEVALMPQKTATLYPTAHTGRGAADPVIDPDAKLSDKT